MVLDSLFGKKEGESKKNTGQELKRYEEEIEELEIRIAYYKKIIEKYAAMINEYEEKTVPELKSLINHSDPSILEIKKQITDKLISEKTARGGNSNYVFSEDFLFVSDSAFKFCQKLAHIHANIPVSFWLTPNEIIEMNAADPFDRALLLCSLLRAFGAPAKIRMLELENNIIHPVVMTEFEEKIFTLDPSQQDSQITTFSGKTLEEALLPFQYGGNKYLKSAYEFSDEEYTEF